MLFYYLIRPLLGLISLLFGVVFSLTPIPFGLLLITLGIILLAPNIKLFQNLLDWVEKNDRSKNQVFTNTIRKLRQFFAVKT